MTRTRKNIAVFPCGSEIGLSLHNCIKYSKFFHLIGLNSIDDHGKYVFEDYIGEVPTIDDSQFIAYLKDIVIQRNIDAIYPAMDRVAYYLKRNEQEIGCKIISSSIDTSRICESKELTYDLLEGIIPIPKRYDPNNIPQYPIFVKPKIGYGSKGTKLIRDEKDIYNITNTKDLLFLEYLPGDEYTVDCFTNHKGELLFCKARKRNRIRNGISVDTFYIEDQEVILHMATLINDKIKFSGAWFFQIKQDINGDLKLLEVADRFGGSSLISKAIGVNLPLLTLFNAFSYEVSIQQNKCNVILDRALENRYKIDINFNTVYVDFDDCLIIDNKCVNYELVSFLYKCINRGIILILLTKHNADIKATLKKFRLSELFDEIIHIDKNDDKSNHIYRLNSIFIDDSFAERMKVLKAKNIPVFGPEMIDVLL